MKNISIKSIGVENLKIFIKKMKLLNDSFFMTYSKGIFKSWIGSEGGRKTKFLDLNLEELESKKEEDVNSKIKEFEKEIRFTFNKNSFLLSVLNFFSKDVDMTISIEEEDDYCFATKVVFSDNKLKLTANCHPDLKWNQLTEPIKNKVLEDKGKLYEFVLKEEIIKKLKDLCALSNQEYYTVVVENNNCIFSKDNFDIIVDDVASSFTELKTSVKFFIDTLDYLDVADYLVKIYKGKAIFNSLTSNSILGISTAIINEE